MSGPVFWTERIPPRYGQSVQSSRPAGTIVPALLIGAVSVAGCGRSHGASRPPQTAAAVEPTPEVADDADAQALARALDARLTVWTRPDGTRVHVRHCRRAPGGCPARIAVFSNMIAGVAHEYDLDPFLLAAMAMRESALNPAVIGAAGEAGIVQLHPQGAGHDVRFVQDEDYRQRCVEKPRACQRPVLEVGARYLAKAMHECGSMDAALGYYSTGSCNPDARYPRRVLRERRKLRAQL